MTVVLRQRQHQKTAGRNRREQITDHQDQPAIEAVRQMAGGNRASHHRDELKEPDVSERERRARDSVNLPAHRHRLNLNRENREEARAQKTAKVAMRQGAWICGRGGGIHRPSRLYWKRAPESTFCQSPLISRRLPSWTSQRSELTSIGCGTTRSSPSWSSTFASPTSRSAFDRDWKAHGHMDRVVARFEDWARRQPIRGMKLEVVRLEGRTPLLFMEIPGDSKDCVLLYGHMDKQPEMSGWREGLGPWNPVLEGDRLYGRGSADDGYAMFSCLGAIGALQANSVKHARCVVVIEACEESGSFDLPHYISISRRASASQACASRSTRDAATTISSGCTTSLRGLVGGKLQVEVLTEGVHSGDAGGVVPDSFRIVRQLLSRVEDEATGKVLAPEFHAKIPDARLKQAAAAAAVLGDDICTKFPFIERTRPVSNDTTELILNRAWRPALSIIGADGLPPTGNAGNVLRPGTAVSLSLRLPPTVDAKVASQKLKSILENDPPYGCKVTFQANWGASGWDAPALSPWLERSLDAASNDYFGKPTAYMGEGGTIPFMGMLGERFPQAQFLITGVLGPHTNAHGPNEFLHIPTAKGDLLRSESDRRSFHRANAD